MLKTKRKYKAGDVVELIFSNLNIEYSVIGYANDLVKMTGKKPGKENVLCASIPKGWRIDFEEKNLQLVKGNIKTP
jgi:hypothetical protein